MKRFSASVHASLGEFIGRYSPRRADIIMQIGRAPRNRANTRSDESVTEVNARWIVWSRVGGGGGGSVQYLQDTRRDTLFSHRGSILDIGREKTRERMWDG